MHVVETKFTPKSGKIYKRILIRESYREGKKVKKRTIANITHCSEAEITAIKFALKHKKNWHEIGNIKDIKNKQGLSFGAIFVVHELTKKLGMEKALNSFDNSQQAKLALWQIIARLIDQGSRLSSVRMARDEASDEILHFNDGFNEDDLYKNLAWLGDNQEEIEKRLFKIRKGKEKPTLFLYDVTSSYLEGMCNELAEWGYNRDKKKGKKQIVIGLLCDDEGVPVSVEVFMGNTNDTATFTNQIEKVSKRFNCQKVIFVGDKGMIKSAQIEELNNENFHYITSITKPQIEKLIQENVFQLELFEDNLVEIQHEGVRYILRKNPVRADEVKQNRAEKQIKIEEIIQKQNDYLQEHPKAKMETAVKKIENKINQLKLKKWLSIEIQERKIQIVIDEKTKQKEAEFDGCYVIKTDLKQEDLTTQAVHDRYKDLAKVEWAFRTSKTTHLEIRPLYVVKEKSTRGHMLICMLAYMIEQELRKAWQNLDITPAEGLKRLRTLCTTIMQTQDNAEFHQVPIPNHQIQELLIALNIKLPDIISKKKVHVDTRKKIKS